MKIMWATSNNTKSNSKDLSMGTTASTSKGEIRLTCRETSIIMVPTMSSSSDALTSTLLKPSWSSSIPKRRMKSKSKLWVNKSYQYLSNRLTSIQLPRILARNSMSRLVTSKCWSRKHLQHKSLAPDMKMWALTVRIHAEQGQAHDIIST